MSLRADDTGDGLGDAGRGGFKGLVQLARGLLQPLLELLKGLGAKNLLKDLLALLSGGQQQFEEVPLGDHGDLGELAAVYAQKVHNGPVHISQLCDYSAIGEA